MILMTSGRFIEWLSSSISTQYYVIKFVVSVFPSTPVSSTNKTDILLKGALNTINQTLDLNIVLYSLLCCFFPVFVLCLMSYIACVSGLYILDYPFVYLLIVMEMSMHPGTAKGLVIIPPCYSYSHVR
jgi:hypothetical protein